MLLTPVLNFGQIVEVEPDRRKFSVEFRISVPHKGDDVVTYTAVELDPNVPDDEQHTSLISIDRDGVIRLLT